MVNRATRVLVGLLGILLVSSAPVGDDVDSLETNVMFAEFDYEEKWDDLAAAQWKLVSRGGSAEDVINKRDAVENFAQAQRFNGNFLRNFWTDNRMTLPDNLQERFYLADHPGDGLLPEQRYHQMANFSSNMEQQYYTQLISCYQNTSENCVLRLLDVQKILSKSGDPEQLLHLWKEWHEALAPAEKEFLSFLEAEKEAAALNEADDVESYWKELSDAEISYKEAEGLWNEIKHFYEKLHLYVSRWLQHNYGPSEVSEVSNTSSIPAHLLGSVMGEHWSSLAELVLPASDKTLTSIKEALNKKEMNHARALYGQAFKSLDEMGVPAMPRSQWVNSIMYNGSCPGQSVQFWEERHVKVITCPEVGWPEMVDAYTNAGRIVHSHLVATSRRHILRESVRFSVLKDAVPGMIGLVAASPHHLANMGLLKKGEGSEAETLRLLVALDTLPRLAYYLAADKWRLELLRENKTSPAKLWKKYRLEYLRVKAESSDDGDYSFLSDPYITSNKPYLGKFVALLHQFQLLDYLTEDDPENPLEAIRDREELDKLMAEGQSQKFRDLALQSVSTDSIARYFEPLESLLDESIPKDAPKVDRKAVEEVSASRRMSSQFVEEGSKDEDGVIDSEIEQNDDEAGTESDILRDATAQDIPMSSTEPFVISVNESVSESPMGNVTRSQVLDTESEKPVKASPEANSAILFGSLTVFLLALGAGFFVAGRRFYKRKYERNRRPSS